MKKFIDHLVSKRSEAKKKVEKEIFKLILDPAFDKMFRPGSTSQKNLKSGRYQSLKNQLK